MNEKNVLAKELAFREMLYKMNVLPEYPDYSSSDYWNKRYTNERGQSNEWLQDYQSLRPFMLEMLGKFYDAEILNIGCGNSRFSEFLYKDGFKNITNIDFSPVVIQEMNDKYNRLEEMEYTVMDALGIQFEPSCFDIIFDKGTFDCILSSEVEPERKINSMLDNVYRVLKDKGEFILITIGRPDENLSFLKQARLGWNVQIFELDKPTVPVFRDFEDEQFHYMYICTKGK